MMQYKKFHPPKSSRLSSQIACGCPTPGPCTATRPQTAAARPTVFYRTSALPILALQLRCFNSIFDQFDPPAAATQSIR